MFRPRLTFLLKILCMVTTVSHSEPIYKKLGDSVVLKTGLPSTNITIITWYQNNDLAMMWDKNTDTSIAYRQFKERGQLNVSNGELMLNGLEVKDIGNYRAEINNNLAKSINLEVLLHVPKPQIKNMDNCTNGYSCLLHCSGKTDGAEPVTYTWLRDNEMTEITHSEINITKKKDRTVRKLTCLMRNPVTQSMSDPFENPLFLNITLIIVSVVIGVLSIIVVIVIFHQRRTGNWFYKSEFWPWKAVPNPMVTM